MSLNLAIKNGRLLSWLAKGQLAVTHISGIRAKNGTLLWSPKSVNLQFLSCYRSLYSTRVVYTVDELGSYLDLIDFTRLDSDPREELEGDITLEELQEALGQLQLGKTPGIDGIPTAVYSLHQDFLAPHLLSMFEQCFSRGSLHESMSEAVTSA